MKVSFKCSFEILVKAGSAIYVLVILSMSMWNLANLKDVTTVLLLSSASLTVGFIMVPVVAWILCICFPIYVIEGGISSY